MSMEGSWLPRDLLYCVVDHIDLKDKSSLLNVLASCRTLRALAEPRFYHNAAFKINASRDHLRLGERIKGFYEQISKDHARLAPFVRQFTYVSGRSKTITADNSLLIKILPLLINLEYFRFSNFDLDVNNTCVLKFIRSPKLQTVIWACLLKQSQCLEEFLHLHPSIRHLEVPFKDRIDPLPTPFLPHLRELVARPEVAWTLHPGRRITHLRLHTTRFQSPRLPTKCQDLLSLTHFSMSSQTSILRYFDLINHMPNLQCLVCSVLIIGIRITELPSLFATNDADSKFQGLAYFSLDTGRRLDSPIPIQTVFDLFKGVPSLRVFDLKADDSLNFTRYRHDGQSTVMPLPMFEGTWPSDHELSRILKTPVQIVSQ